MPADDIIGTWKATGPAGKATGFDGFVKEMEVEPNFIDQYKETVFGAIYSKEGDTWKASVTANGNVIKTVTFTSGVEFEMDGMDGKKYKVKAIIDGNENTEVSVPLDKPGAQGTTTTRTINGDEMKVTVKSNKNTNIEMKYTMKKQ
ncbi:fatty acid-binding protein 1-like [Argopecten irradians]|uniref:fatty acid-binding protein 1-like n=1 Tax=Argopecten irradians TaxID=31199 RepID=UPI003722C537